MLFGGHNATPLFLDGYAQNFGVFPLIASSTITGTVLIGGEPLADGATINIYSDVGGLITSTTTTGGAGGFSVNVPDVNTVYFASYTDGSTIAARSLGHTATASLVYNITTNRAASPLGSLVVRSNV